MPVACFSKLPKTFRARKAVPKTSTRSFCKASFFIVSSTGRKIKITAKFRALRRLRFENTKRTMSPKCARKVSGLSRNGPLTYRVFSHDVTGAILVSLNNGTRTTAMLMSPTIPRGIEIYSFVLAEKPAHRSREPKHHSNINRCPIPSIIGNSLQL